MIVFKIKSVSDFWTWSTDKLAKGLRAQAWYENSQPYGLAGYINDTSSRLIGYATMRQVRDNESKNSRFGLYSQL